MPPKSLQLKIMMEKLCENEIRENETNRAYEDHL